MGNKTITANAAIAHLSQVLNSHLLLRAVNIFPLCFPSLVEVCDESAPTANRGFLKVWQGRVESLLIRWNAEVLPEFGVCDQDGPALVDKRLRIRLWID